MLFNHPRDYWHKPADLPDSFWTRHFELHAVSDRATARTLLPENLSRTAYLGEGFPELVSGASARSIRSPSSPAWISIARRKRLMSSAACVKRAGWAHWAMSLHRGVRGGRVGIRHRARFPRSLRRYASRSFRTIPIIALNAGAAVLHYQVLDRRAPMERHSMLIDAGAEFAGYASDITRTYSNTDADFAKLVERNGSCAAALCASVHAGVDWRDVHISSHRLVSELLHDSGIITIHPDTVEDQCHAVPDPPAADALDKLTISCIQCCSRRRSLAFQPHGVRRQLVEIPSFRPPSIGRSSPRRNSSINPSIAGSTQTMCSSAEVVQEAPQLP